MIKNLTNSVYNTKNGRYVFGGITEVSVKSLEMWSRNKMNPDPTDLVYFFEKKYEGRPDILGYVFYGDPGLWWVITQYNSIIDPLELIEGQILLIPTLDRVKSELFNNTSVGGVSSTRK